MKKTLPALLLVGLTLAAWEGLLRPALLPAALAQTPAAADQPKDNEELARLYREDQGDRTPGAGKTIDWAVVGPRDREREARIKELYKADELHTGADFFHAAMVLQHG